MVEVYKTYKMFVNNEFVRSESGRSYKIFDKNGNFLANIPRSSKKDLRDAVRYSKNALKSWNNKSNYNKGQIIYRMAEELENRKYEIINELKKHNIDNPYNEVQKSVDRLIHYAGWTDKYSHILGTVNTVTSSFINYSVPEYVGVVACITLPNPPLLSFITQVIPAIVAGNTVVSIINENPLPILTFAEILKASDLPPGVINILTQHNNELIDHIVKHFDINLIDYIGNDKQIIDKIFEGSSINVKRIRTQNLDPQDFFDDYKSEGLYWIEKFIEIKTVWIPQSL
ncbi:MAG: aldehyde dehydrogenase family protein [bacterium]|nr:aldehyde dehydrogenase family protein [bacterium]